MVSFAKLHIIRQRIRKKYKNRVRKFSVVYYVKKASQIQNFRILESLVDFIMNFEVWNLGLKTFKKALSQERELFESFSPKLQIL